jgi:tripartite-type tricarboxylate transporter receptor subunit TctC
MISRAWRWAVLWIAPLLAVVLQMIVSLPAGAADADDGRGYPSRPVHLIVAFPAGTAVDGLARLVASRLEQSIGQSVVVENRPGAGGNIGTSFAARAVPDGYTLAIIGASVTINPALHGAKVVDPAREFAPVIQLTAQPIVLVAHPSLPASTMSELIELARRKPGRIAYSTPGIGTPTHIAAELVAQRAGIEWLHVPYTGSGPILKDVLTGEVPLSFTLLGGAEPYLRAGQLKAIAVTSERRVSALPSVPTIAESAFPGYEVTSWHGVVAPARTPLPIIERLQRALATIVTEPDVVARLRSLGMEPAGSTSTAFKSRIESEMARWRDVVVRGRISVD